MNILFSGNGSKLGISIITIIWYGQWYGSHTTFISTTSNLELIINALRHLLHNNIESAVDNLFCRGETKVSRGNEIPGLYFRWNRPRMCRMTTAQLEAVRKCLLQNSLLIRASQCATCTVFESGGNAKLWMPFLRVLRQIFTMVRDHTTDQHKRSMIIK